MNELNLISREALKKVFLSYDYLNMGLYTMSMFDIIKVIDNAPTVTDRYDEGFRDGYAQCINDKEERKENNRLFRKGGKE